MNLKNKKIGVLYGGTSSEREISIRSGENIYQALKRKGYHVIKIDMDRHVAKILEKKKIDFVYIILHGSPGEDGTIQGMLDIMGIPYTGSGVLGSSMGLNKIITKQLFKMNKIPTPDYSIIKEKIFFEEIKALGTPLIFKPYAEGSSVGVKKFNSMEEFNSEIEDLIRKYKYGLVEKFLSGINITIGVLENKTEIIALPILQLMPENEFYDFESKYTKGKTRFILPAELNEELTVQAKNLAIKVHQVLWCYGVSRVDMLVVDNQLYVLEVNTIPGMTETSDLPAEAEAMGISFDDLVEKILISGWERQETHV